ncbi:MAG: hypothetical protein ACI9OJ_004487 [Myxococcota bacterium]|jgi:hypothetical protein
MEDGPWVAAKAPIEIANTAPLVDAGNPPSQSGVASAEVCHPVIELVGPRPGRGAKCTLDLGKQDNVGRGNDVAGKPNAALESLLDWCQFFLNRNQARCNRLLVSIDSAAKQRADEASKRGDQIVR